MAAQQPSERLKDSMNRNEIIDNKIFIEKFLPEDRDKRLACTEVLPPDISAKDKDYKCENQNYVYCGTGAITRSFKDTGYTLTIHDCTFLNFGSTTQYEGCFTLNSKGGGSNWEITGSTFTACRVGQSGSAIHFRKVNIALVQNCTFQECTQSTWSTESYGGAINIHGSCSKLTFSRNIFLNNYNGGIVIRGGNSEITLEMCIFKDSVVNTLSTVISPGILTFIPLIVDRCIFENNNGKRCGAIGLEAKVAITLTHCEVRYCTSTNGIFKGFTSNDVITIEHSIFEYNTGTSIDFPSVSSMSINNCSFTSSGSKSVSITGSLTVTSSCFSYLDNVTSTNGIHITATSATIDELSKFKGDAATISASGASSIVFDSVLTCPISDEADESPKPPVSPTSPPTPEETPTPEEIPTLSESTKPTETAPPTPIVHCGITLKANEELYREHTDFNGEGCDSNYYITTSATIGFISLYYCNFKNYLNTKVDYGGCIILTNNAGAKYVEINGSSFDNCKSGISGAACYFNGISDHATIIDTSFTQCDKTKTTGTGGALQFYRYSKNIIVDSCHFDQCNCGCFLSSQNSNTLKKIYNCTFENSDSTLYSKTHPGIFINSQCAIENCSFTNLIGETDGAIAFSKLISTFSLISCCFENCEAMSSQNDVIAIETSEINEKLNIENCIFYKNSAASGKSQLGIYSMGDVVVKDTSFISSGTNSIHFSGSSGSISNCCFGLSSIDLNAQAGIHIQMSSTCELIIDSKTQFQGTEATVAVGSINKGKFTLEPLDCKQREEETPGSQSDIIIIPSCNLDINEDFTRINEE